MASGLRSLWRGIAHGLAAWAGLAIAGLALWTISLCANVLTTRLADPGKEAHDKLEALSFAANVSVPILAIVAGYIAYRQFGEAKDTRVATLYLQIMEKYNSDLLREGRRNIRRLSDAHRAGASGQDFGLYLADLFDNLSARDLDDPGFEVYNSCLRQMEFWEEVGVLVRRGLVDCEVLLDYMAGNIRYAEECFRPFIDAKWRANGNFEIYANAFWLMDQARFANAYTYAG